jgi:predicted SnoaL-like aldol condensation-catalyzing enzyme
MKTKALFLFTVALLIMAPAVSTAQVGGLLRNKLNRVVNAGSKTVNKEIDHKIDSAAQKKTQEEIDKANQEREQNKNQEAQGQTGQTEGNKTGSGESKGFNLGGLMGGKVTSKYNESYSFTSRIYQQMEMYDKKDKVTKMDYYIYFSEADPIMGIETKIEASSDEGDQVAMNSSIVIDGPNKSYISMTDVNNMKMGFISAVPDENSQVQTSGKTKTPPVVTKTGKTKVIAGYKCDEYTYKDEGNKRHGTIWATKDLKLNVNKSAFSKAGMSSYYGNADLDNSVALAMEQYNDKNELELKSDTKEVNKSFSHSISTTGYNFRQMNFNQAGGQQKK